MKTVVLAYGAMILTAASALAQGRPTDYWATERECQAATSAPFYQPLVTCDEPLGPGEVVRPHLTGGCFLMRLPDRYVGGFNPPDRGWVRIEPGRPFIMKNVDGKLVTSRLAKCCNEIFAEASFRSLTTNATPAPPTAATTIADSINRIAGNVTVNHNGTVKVDHTGTVKLDDGGPPAPTSRGNWFSWDRNGKWFWPTAAVVVGGGGYCAAVKCLKVVQIQY